MVRQTRRPAPQQGVTLHAPVPAAVPVPGPETPRPEPVRAPRRQRFGGRGDHDHDGRVGGAAPAVPAEPAREKSLHELNQEAWAADAEHRRLRREAEERMRAEIAPMLEGVPRLGRSGRRAQKALRAPVTE